MHTLFATRKKTSLAHFLTHPQGLVPLDMSSFPLNRVLRGNKINFLYLVFEIICNTKNRKRNRTETWDFRKGGQV